MLCRITSVLVALMLAGCATKPQTVSVVDRPAKTVAVVASMGPKIIVGTTGVTVFEKATDAVEVPEWDLDGVAAKAMTEALSSRFQVIVAKPREQLVDSDSRLTKAVNSTLAIETEVRQKVTFSQPVDLVVALTLSNTAQPYRQGHETVDFGVGVSKWRQPFGTRAPRVHTYLEMAVLDGATLKVLATKSLVVPNSAGTGEAPPVVGLKGFEWHDYWHEMTPEQQDLIHQRIVSLLTQGVPYTLKQMKLAP